MIRLARLMTPKRVRSTPVKPRVNEQESEGFRRDRV
jgi:hypothetical protein